MSAGWLVHEHTFPVHVTPIDDLREHSLLPTCWCKPLCDTEVAIHNSYDRREASESDGGRLAGQLH